ncbi:MAG: 2-oxo acid dehydrogenase subunit E2 [Clostridia bacterium]|nr:2-oxo acid dehydrogenase subunit E2 [Clostridia bacterium]
MATPVMMPNVGISVESCILTEWHKKKGDTVKAGEVLFSYETDKSTADEVAEVDGTVLELFFNEGDDIPVMTNVCVIGKEGESVEEFRPAGEAEEAPAAAPVAEAAPAAEAAPVAPVAPAAPQEGFVKCSPRARALAEKAGVDPRFATPTGAEGRVVEKDIRALMASGATATPASVGAYEGQAGTGLGGRFSVNDINAPAAAAAPAAPAAAYVDEKMSSVRRAIAKAMNTSLTTIPQLTHTITFDATEIMNFRKKLKAGAEALGLGNITLNDMMIFAVSRVLSKPEHKALNANLIDGDTMRYFSGVHVGVATDTDRGLLVPTLFDADKKSLNEISAEAKALFAEAKAGNISPDKLKGASFTISNLGSLGIEHFTPVINPPQTGILGVDAITTRVREENGEIKTYPAMGLSLTYDHRALDGAPASKFLMDLKNTLENFSILLCR